MISTNEFKTNVTVTIDGDAWQVVEFQHVKPGKGAAFVRAKMRNMCTGSVVERTFNAWTRWCCGSCPPGGLRWSFRGST